MTFDPNKLEFSKRQKEEMARLVEGMRQGLEAAAPMMAEFGRKFREAHDRSLADFGKQMRLMREERDRQELTRHLGKSASSNTDPTSPPTHEWYRPDTLDGLSEWSADHVRKGGLLLREIGGGDAKDGWQKSDPEEIVAAKREAMIADYFRKIAEIEADYGKRIVGKEAAPSSIKREDYPSRQAYRHAVTRHRKARP